jgi:hypothetical protein
MTNEEYEALLDQDEKMLEAGSASEFLARQWGMTYYSTDALKMRRRRGEIEPDQLIGNASLWRISTLKKISKPVRGRKKQEVEGGDNGQSSVR